MKLIASQLAAFLLTSLIDAQTSGSVGPTTTTTHQRITKQCNVLNYGVVAFESYDAGLAIASAWASCRSGGKVYIPPGNYGMATWVRLNIGTAVSIGLDGITHHTGQAVLPTPEFSRLICMDSKHWWRAYVCNRVHNRYLIIRGGNEGGLDGIGVQGTNIWIHDVEVTNKDECVTVYRNNPPSYILVENIYCHWSGGSSMGLLGADVGKSHVYFKT